ncbi:hypothetical protein [Pseudomonas sp. GV071]|uniref:hypothetical protein n=1 Tax=Pseudomonas sp. GV071 TaxID=2135754 RepID=UPI000D365878|nr:hypothetical protein [Pseudomonas sp. GV071]PTQ71492.1 hypothetical protein C8K61_10439 [Pseudomonas sp. GV071]
MAREDIEVMLSVVWVITAVCTGAFYFICTAFAYGLTEKKWSVLSGWWFLSPSDFPTAEGRRWCRRGGLCFALLMGLFAIQYVGWHPILEFFSSIQLRS